MTHPSISRQTLLQETIIKGNKSKEQASLKQESENAADAKKEKR